MVAMSMAIVLIPSVLFFATAIPVTLVMDLTVPTSMNVLSMNHVILMVPVPTTLVHSSVTATSVTKVTDLTAPTLTNVSLMILVTLMVFVTIPMDLTHANVPLDILETVSIVPILTNVCRHHVTDMGIVMIPMVHTHVPVTMDLLVMDSTVQISTSVLIPVPCVWAFVMIMPTVLIP
jgi:hypothetical protein